MRFALVLSAALLALASAAPKEAEVAPYNQFNDLFNKAIVDAGNLIKGIKDLFNIPDQDVLVKNIKDQYASFTAGVQTFFKNFSEEFQKKSPELAKALDEAKVNFLKVTDELNKSVPNAQESAEQLKLKFNEGVETFLKEAKAAAERFKQDSPAIKEEATKFVQKAVDLAVKSAHDFNETVTKAVAAAKN